MKKIFSQNVHLLTLICLKLTPTSIFMRILFIFIIFLFVTTCKKTHVQIIPDEVRPMVNLFFEEGQKRSFPYLLYDFDIEIVFVDFLPDANGICYGNQHKIELDRDDWNRMDAQTKEWVVFHELGHCILGRSHINSQLPNGECKSFMKGGNFDFDCSLNLYSSKWRSFYLDELFNDLTLSPDWYEAEQLFLIPDEEKEIIYETQNDTIIPFEADFSQLDQDRDFVFETEFINRKEDRVKISWDNKIFQYANSTVRSVMLMKQEAENTFDYFYNNHSFGGNIKLTVRKKGDFQFFYVNEKLVHKMEYQPMENMLFQASSTDQDVSIQFSYFYDN